MGKAICASQRASRPASAVWHCSCMLQLAARMAMSIRGRRDLRLHGSLTFLMARDFFRAARFEEAHSMKKLLGIGLAVSVVLSLAADQALARGGRRSKRWRPDKRAQGRMGSGQSAYGRSSAAMQQQQRAMQYRYRYGQSASANQRAGRRQQMQGRMQQGLRNGQGGRNSQNGAMQQQLRDGSCTGQAASGRQGGRSQQGMRARSGQARICGRGQSPRRQPD